MDSNVFVLDSPNKATISTMENMDQQELTVTFFPPLYEQRRAWVLDVLRNERVTSVIDIGCGEGTLLRCLCNPSSYIPQSPTIAALELDETSSPNLTSHSSSSSHNPHPPNHPEAPTIAFDLDFHQILELRVTRLAGLDVSEPELESCVSATAPRPSSSANDTKNASEHFGYALPRWEPLSVQVWRGSLDVLNENFIGAECIVSSEVIEHLEPDILPFFAPMLLGVYHPHLLLVTTPNYTFNQRFSVPGSPDPEGYPDPTGRTGRIFRHHDHKFEWTTEEFTEYCENEARRYGYSVEIDAIGLPLTEDPWGREEVLGKASQTALFRRLDKLSQGEVNSRNEALSEVRGLRRQGHELIAEHVHEVHPRTRNPSSTAEILSVVRATMETYYTAEGWSIWELWITEEISASCGGYLSLLLSSIVSCDYLELIRIEEVPATEWRIKFRGEKHKTLTEEGCKKSENWRLGTSEINHKRAEHGYDSQGDAFRIAEPSEWPTTESGGNAVTTTTKAIEWDSSDPWGTFRTSWGDNK